MSPCIRDGPGPPPTAGIVRGHPGWPPSCPPPRGRPRTKGLVGTECVLSFAFSFEPDGPRSSIAAFPASLRSDSANRDNLYRAAAARPQLQLQLQNRLGAHSTTEFFGCAAALGPSA